MTNREQVAWSFGFSDYDDRAIAQIVSDMLDGKVWPLFRGGNPARRLRPTLTNWPRRKGGRNGTADNKG